MSDGTTIVSLEMRYDAAGRLWAKRQLPAWPAVPAPTPRSATADADNRLESVGGTAVVHDADGNVESAPSALGSGIQSYTWNARNQLVGGSSGVTRTYTTGGWEASGETAESSPEGEMSGSERVNCSALGNRISMTANGTTTTYAVDPVGGSMPRVLWSQRGSEERVFYVYAGDTLLYQFTETGNVAHYYHYDHIGSTVALSDASASVSDRFAYSTYGREIGRTGTTPTPFRFCGAHGVMTDPDGLVHMRARYYHPGLGRFLSEDPIQFEGGTNWYAYADGNPAMFVDPEGLHVIYLNNSKAAMFQGHTAALVGSDETGWNYYSKDGYGNGKWSKDDNENRPFNSFSDFYKNPESAQYDRGIYVQTSVAQDLSMIAYGDKNYKHNYCVANNNCGDLVSGIMASGGVSIPGGSILGTPRPNSQYGSLAKAGIGTSFIMHPKPSLVSTIMNYKSTPAATGGRK